MKKTKKLTLAAAAGAAALIAAGCAQTPANSKSVTVKQKAKTYQPKFHKGKNSCKSK